MSCGYGMTCILPNILSGSTSLYLLMKFCYIIYSGDYDYELWLRYDLYTSKHTQWFISLLLMKFCYIYSGDYDYELWLRYDLYTSKHTQWFYFSILVNEVLLYLQWGL